MAFATTPAELGDLLELPTKAQALRDHGLDAAEVQTLLGVIRRSDLSAKQAVDLVAHSGKLVQQHGPIEKFTDFVDQRIQAGDRGAALHTALTKAHESKTPPPEPEPVVEPEPAPAPAAPRVKPRRPRPPPAPKVQKGKGYTRPATKSSGTKGKGSTR